VDLTFSNVLWSSIAVIEVFLVAARIVLHPSPLRLAMAFLIPLLIILGAVANAIYNRIKTGHALDDPFVQAKRH